MKYRVIKRFKDKYTRDIYIPGDLFESKETARINDLLNRKLIEEVQQNYGSLAKKELMKLLEENGIEFDAKAKKNELIKLLQGGD